MSTAMMGQYLCIQSRRASTEGETCSKIPKVFQIQDWNSTVASLKQRKTDQPGSVRRVRSGEREISLTRRSSSMSRGQAIETFLGP